MDTALVKNLVSKLNYEWFKEKSIFFLKEGLYNEEHGKIYDIITYSESIEDNEANFEEEIMDIVVDIDLAKYCWDSYFYGSNGEHLLNSESESIYKILPVDAIDISHEILWIINNYIEKFTDVKAIDIIIKKVMETMRGTVSELQKSTNDPSYIKVLNEFVVKSTSKINEDFHHIKQQIELRNSGVTLERNITKEICSKIANFRIGNKKLITSVSGELSMGEAIFYLLNSYGEKKTNIKLRIEDWLNNDVYYLIYRLSQIVTDNISIADIDHKKVLYLRTGKLFLSGTYDSFKSQKLEIYKSTNANKSSIDSQLASLF